MHVLYFPTSIRLVSIDKPSMVLLSYTIILYCQRKRSFVSYVDENDYAVHNIQASWLKFCYDVDTVVA